MTLAVERDVKPQLWLWPTTRSHQLYVGKGSDFMPVRGQWHLPQCTGMHSISSCGLIGQANKYGQTALWWLHKSGKYSFVSTVTGTRTQIKLLNGKVIYIYIKRASVRASAMGGQIVEQGSGKGGFMPVTGQWHLPQSTSRKCATTWKTEGNLVWLSIILWYLCLVLCVSLRLCK